MNFVEELRWRGMIHNIMPGTEEQLAKEQTTAYVVCSFANCSSVPGMILWIIPLHLSSSTKFIDS